MSSYSNVGPISKLKAKGKIKMGNNYQEKKIHRLKNHYVEGIIG